MNETSGMSKWDGNRADSLKNWTNEKWTKHSYTQYIYMICLQPISNCAPIYSISFGRNVVFFLLLWACVQHTFVGWLLFFFFHKKKNIFFFLLTIRIHIFILIPFCFFVHFRAEKKKRTLFLFTFWCNNMDTVFLLNLFCFFFVSLIDGMLAWGMRNIMKNGKRRKEKKTTEI